MTKEIHFNITYDELKDLVTKKRGRPANKVWWKTKRVYFHRLYDVTNEQWSQINALCNKINEENKKKALEII